MSGNTFEFKKFSIKQDKCTMKVNTDAVLLGAWVNPISEKNILDIGTGTGVIALMLAQKSNANIIAIDIDNNSIEQAKENVLNCSFAKNTQTIHSSFQNFAASTNLKFDLIVSNPPFYPNSVKINNQPRSLARHAETLPFEELIIGITKTLTNEGRFCLILPKQEAESFVTSAKQHNLFLTKLLRVRTKPNADTEKRHLMQFEFKEKGYSEATLIVENEKHFDYTEAYKSLTKDYYLNF
jgi:tRNA1Val (adenine37-N6)-methyltransferase